MFGKILYKLTHIILRFLIATFCVCGFFVLTQDFQIFPHLFASFFNNQQYTSPNDVEEFEVTSKDGQTVKVWRVTAEKTDKKTSALLFHGNAETIASFVQVQYWLKSLGITSYSVEYRGYAGRNSGWPSEAGLYLDAEAAFQILLDKEKIQPSDSLVFGSSIGTGIASYIAQKFSVGTLVLLSPYSSLPDLVSDLPLFGKLSPFLKYNFSTSEHINNLKNTCVISVHGQNDNTIPIQHSKKLEKLYQGSSSFTLIASEDAGHNDLLNYTKEQLAHAIKVCMAKI